MFDDATAASVVRTVNNVQGASTSTSCNGAGNKSLRCVEERNACVKNVFLVLPDVLLAPLFHFTVTEICTYVMDMVS